MSSDPTFDPSRLSLNNLLPTFSKVWRKDGCDLEVTLQVSQVVDSLRHMGVVDPLRHIGIMTCGQEPL